MPSSAKISLWHDAKRPIVYVNTGLWIWALYWPYVVANNAGWENSLTLNTEAFLEIPSIPMEDFESTPIKYTEDPIFDEEYQDQETDIRVCYGTKETDITIQTKRGVSDFRPSRPTLLLWDGHRQVSVDYKYLKALRNKNHLVLSDKWNDLYRYVEQRKKERIPSRRIIDIEAGFRSVSLYDIIAGPRNRKDNSLKLKALREQRAMEKMFSDAPDMSPRALTPRRK